MGMEKTEQAKSGMMTTKPWMATATSVVPVDDLREHDPDNEECWCRPFWIDRAGPGKGDGRHILVHNSADRREEYETSEH